MVKKKTKSRPGRDRLPEHDLRLPCHGLRLKAYWIFWLKKHPRKGGRMIEEALANYFCPDENAIIADFYGRKYRKDEKNVS